MAAKKPNPFSAKFEGKETKKMEKGESPAVKKKEAAMGLEKPMPFMKKGGKVKGC